MMLCYDKLKLVSASLILYLNQIHMNNNIENLLQRLPELSDEQFKREYLTYLEFTQPIVEILQHVDKALVLRIVKLALEVD